MRSVAYQIKAARFPVYKYLTGFDFSSCGVNEALIRQLHHSEFTEKAENIVLVGGPGTGKTHIATALAINALEHHRKKARFYSTVELALGLYGMAKAFTDIANGGEVKDLEPYDWLALLLDRETT